MILKVNGHLFTSVTVNYRMLLLLFYNKEDFKPKWYNSQELPTLVLDSSD